MVHVEEEKKKRIQTNCAVASTKKKNPGVERETDHLPIREKKKRKEPTNSAYR